LVRPAPTYTAPVAYSSVAPVAAYPGYYGGYRPFWGYFSINI